MSGATTVTVVRSAGAREETSAVEMAEASGEAGILGVAEETLAVGETLEAVEEETSSANPHHLLGTRRSCPFLHKGVH